MNRLGGLRVRMAVVGMLVCCRMAAAVVTDGRTRLVVSGSNGALVSLGRAPDGRELIRPEADWWEVQGREGNLRPSGRTGSNCGGRGRPRCSGGGSRRAGCGWRCG
jgi:hypothetical protein